MAIVWADGGWGQHFARVGGFLLLVAPEDSGHYKISINGLVRKKREPALGMAKACAEIFARAQFMAGLEALDAPPTDPVTKPYPMKERKKK